LLRFILLLLVIASGFSLCFWIDYEHRSIIASDRWELDGAGSLRSDARQARLLNVVSSMKHQLIVTGRSGWGFCQSALLANLTLNSDYTTWSFHCDVDVYPNSLSEATKREHEINALYDGKNDEPLLYLRQRNIAALVIWPYDNITDGVLAKLKQQLAPEYAYRDCREGTPLGPPNEGVFLYRPHLLSDAPSNPPSLAPALDPRGNTSGEAAVGTPEN
jgi:hypothetical protein